MPATTGDKVRVHYRGTLEDGSEFDSSAESGPIEFELGKPGVIQGFQDAVMGLEIGESRQVVLPPEKAYGEPTPNRIVHLPVGNLDFEPEIGREVGLSAQDGRVAHGKITAIEGDDVTVDINHPLAGKTLNFDITLDGIVEKGE